MMILTPMERVSQSLQFILELFLFDIYCLWVSYLILKSLQAQGRNSVETKTGPGNLKKGSAVFQGNTEKVGSGTVAEAPEVDTEIHLRRIHHHHPA